MKEIFDVLRHDHHLAVEAESESVIESLSKIAVGAFSLAGIYCGSQKESEPFADVFFWEIVSVKTLNGSKSDLLIDWQTLIVSQEWLWAYFLAEIAMLLVSERATQICLQVAFCEGVSEKQI